MPHIAEAVARSRRSHTSARTPPNTASEEELPAPARNLQTESCAVFPRASVSRRTLSRELEVLTVLQKPPPSEDAKKTTFPQLRTSLRPKTSLRGARMRGTIPKANMNIEIWRAPRVGSVSPISCITDYREGANIVHCKASVCAAGSCGYTRRGLLVKGARKQYDPTMMVTVHFLSLAQSCSVSAAG